MEDELIYNTRDGKGKDITKAIKIKRHKCYTTQDFICGICKNQCRDGVRIKDVVSGHFTDWQYVDDIICRNCETLFSLYKNSYIVEGQDKKIKLMNVREIKENLTRNHKTPFRFIISTSQKKHLFYNSMENYSDDVFSVNLEKETITTTKEEQKELFDMIESLQSLGCTKDDMKKGMVKDSIVKCVGNGILIYLQKKLQKREIQIPLFCGQKNKDKSEEELLCNINSILKAYNMERLR